MCVGVGVGVCVCVCIQQVYLSGSIHIWGGIEFTELNSYQSSVKPGEAHRDQLNGFGFMVNSTFCKDGRYSM